MWGKLNSYIAMGIKTGIAIMEVSVTFSQKSTTTTTNYNYHMTQLYRSCISPGTLGKHMIEMLAYLYLIVALFTIAKNCRKMDKETVENMYNEILLNAKEKASQDICRKISLISDHCIQKNN